MKFTPDLTDGGQPITRQSDVKAFCARSQPIQRLPTPAARNPASSVPRPAQQSANLPLTTTAGTERMPSVRARSATALSHISSTLTSHEGQAMRLTS